MLTAAVGRRSPDKISSLGCNPGVCSTLKGCKGLPGQLLLCAHTHMCVAAPNIQGLHRFRRPSAAASTHMCVAEIRVAPRAEVLSRLCPPTAAASIHTCVSKQIKSGRSQWSKCYKGSAEKIPDRSFGCKFTLSDNLHAKWGINCLYSKIGV